MGARRNEPTPVDDHLLDIEEAARYLNVSPRWVGEAVRQRQVRCVRIGKHVRFRTEHLAELVRACEQPATASPVRPGVPQLQDRRRSRL